MTTDYEKRAAALLLPGDFIEEELVEPASSTGTRMEFDVPGGASLKYETLETVRIAAGKRSAYVPAVISWAKDDLAATSAAARDEILSAFAVPPSVVNAEVTPFAMYEHYIDKKTKSIIGGLAAGGACGCPVCDLEKEAE